MSVPRTIDPQYVATLEAKNEKLEEALHQALRVIKTMEAVMAELHDQIREASRD